MHFLALNWQSIAAFTTAMGAAYAFLRWVYGVAKKVDTTFEYVDELRTNHIPHLQHGLELICKHLGIELTEPPKSSG